MSESENQSIQSIQSNQSTQSTQSTHYERQINDPDILNYPHFWQTSRPIKSIIDEFGSIECETRLYDNIESIMGRILLKRSSGKNLHFYTLSIDGNNFQIMSDVKSYSSADAFYKIHNMLNRGDIIGVKGFIAKTKKGELSLIPSEIILLTPCLHMLPSSHYGIDDKEIRYSNRYLDLIVNPPIRDIFIKRHKIVNFIRNYFVTRDFIEVETPVLSGMAGGAAAKPFITFHNALKQQMYMRIAPELYLKQCVIGGLNKVFEIGKQFRNEDISKVHNPEFTSIELYEAGTDYMALMDMTEDLLQNMAISVNGTHDAKWIGIDISLKGPFQRLDIMDTLQEQIRLKLNDQSFVLPNIDDQNASQLYLDLANKLDIKISLPHTLNRLVDGLIGEFVEPLCVQPTFLINHPQIMSPLAKPHRSQSGKTERFELFINKKEFCNAYTELNNPFIQKAIFEEVAKQKSAGDDEIPPSDFDFVKALEYGLPPTGGWGLGIDRLVMLLTGQDSIREVMLFPTRRL
jgi:lysyl-tRNA synthetase class 2